MALVQTDRAMGKSSGLGLLSLGVISLTLSPRIERVFSDHRFGSNRSILLPDGWAIVLTFLVLLGFTIMTYRNQGRLAVSLLVMGVAFFVTGCCVRFVNPGTANVLRWLLPLDRPSLVLHCISSPKKGGKHHDICYLL